MNKIPQHTFSNCARVRIIALVVRTPNCIIFAKRTPKTFPTELTWWTIKFTLVNIKSHKWQHNVSFFIKLLGLSNSVIETLFEHLFLLVWISKYVYIYIYTPIFNSRPYKTTYEWCTWSGFRFQRLKFNRGKDQAPPRICQNFAMLSCQRSLRSLPIRRARFASKVEGASQLSKHCHLNCWGSCLKCWLGVPKFQLTVLWITSNKQQQNLKKERSDGIYWYDVCLRVWPKTRTRLPVEMASRGHPSRLWTAGLMGGQAKGSKGTSITCAP